MDTSFRKGFLFFVSLKDTRYYVSICDKEGLDFINNIKDSSSYNIKNNNSNQNDSFNKIELVNTINEVITYNKDPKTQLTKLLYQTIFLFILH